MQVEQRGSGRNGPGRGRDTSGLARDISGRNGVLSALIAIPASSHQKRYALAKAAYDASIASEKRDKGRLRRPTGEEIASLCGGDPAVECQRLQAHPYFAACAAIADHHGAERKRSDLRKREDELILWAAGVDQHLRGMLIDICMQVESPAQGGAQ